MFQSHLYGIESQAPATEYTHQARFNRTFMELKEGSTEHIKASSCVSIAPLWN